MDRLVELGALDVASVHDGIAAIIAQTTLPPAASVAALGREVQVTPAARTRRRFGVGGNAHAVRVGRLEIMPQIGTRRPAPYG